MTGTLVHLLATLGPAALVLLMAVAFAETGILVGFLLPGDTLMFSAGVLLAADSVHLPIWLALVAVTISAAAGDQVGFLVGRRFGPRLLNRPKSRIFSPRHLERARRFFAQYGSRAVVLARFVPLVRTMTPVVAGVGQMSRARFALYNLAGAAAWALLTLGGGYWFGGIPVVADHLDVIAVAMVCLSLVPVVATVVRTRLARSRAPQTDTGTETATETDESATPSPKLTTCSARS